MEHQPLLDQVSIALFYPHTFAQKEMHQTLIMVLAVVNILTIVVTFLLSPAL